MKGQFIWKKGKNDWQKYITLLKLYEALIEALMEKVLDKLLKLTKS